MIDKIQKYLWQGLFLATLIALGGVSIKLAVEINQHGKTTTQLANTKAAFAVYIKDQAQLHLEAANRARATEQQLQTAANNAQKEAHAQITTLRRERDAALVSLRQRPDRPAATPGAAAVPTLAGPRPEARGCTGAELYRPDAEFLLGVASDFDELRTKYNELWELYERARSQAEALTDGK